jgi:hypothetical protein
MELKNKKIKKETKKHKGDKPVLNNRIEIN